MIAGPQRPGRPLISEEERQAQLARQRALSQARDAARQLSLGLRHLQGGEADEKSRFTMDAEGKLGKLAKEMQRGMLYPRGMNTPDPPSLEAPVQPGAKKKASTVRHTRAIQRDRSKRPLRAPRLAKTKDALKGTLMGGC